jgi:HK97 family phage major capsid protein
VSLQLEERQEPNAEERAIIETAERKGHRAVGEPLVYSFEKRGSYYRDLALVKRGDMRAVERLERHGRQMADAPKPERRFFPGAEYEQRVNPNLQEGTGGEFAPPLWLNELFATARRPGQVIQRLAPTFDLPPGVSSVNLPRITQGTQAAFDLSYGGSAANDQDVETAAVHSAVMTFAGLSDWSIQSLEQSPAGAHLDWVVFKDLTESSDAEIEKELIVGPGTGERSERFYGLAELPGTNTVTYTSSKPTGTAMFPEIGKALAQVGVKRFMPPEALLMSTSRFYWLATSEDTQNRPLLLEDYPHSDFPNAGLSSCPVYLDDAIPSTLGTAKEQDAIFACRPSDWVILASEPKTSVKLDVLSGTLQARFKLHRYVAALLGRYPSGVSKVTGTGMVLVEGFK